jgi:hypothetical protein
MDAPCSSVSKKCNNNNNNKYFGVLNSNILTCEILFISGEIRHNPGNKIETNKETSSVWFKPMIHAIVFFSSAGLHSR